MLEVIEIIPIKDASVNSAMPYENYGDYYALFIGQYMGHSIYRGLLQFELPSLSGKGIIEKVELLIYISRNDDVSIEKGFEIYRITGCFEENNVNYENSPEIEKEIYKVFAIKDEINTYIKIDITKLFSVWYSGKYLNYGLLIKAVDESQNGLVGFYSKDAKESIYPPKLQIQFNRYMEIDKIDNIDIDISDKLSAEKYYELGNDYYEIGAYVEAYHCYKKSLESQTPNKAYLPKLFFMLTKTLEKLEKYEKALEIIEEGLKNYPDFTDLVYVKARLLYKQEKTHLAIKYLHQCMNMGEAPLQLSIIAGVESYRARYTLAQMYYELGDLEQAYKSCVEALHQNPKYTEPLQIILKILMDKKRDLTDIQSRVEGFLGMDLDGKDYMILGNIFLKHNKYTAAYEYFSNAEEFTGNNSKTSYNKGLCLLYLKEYKKAYDHFAKIKEGDLYEEAVYKRVLCEILRRNMSNAQQILNLLRNPENNCRRMVYYALKDILENHSMVPLSDEKKESERFVDVIFELLDTLIRAADPEIFERALELLNLIDHDEVLLKLGKLYYEQGLYHLAYQEFIRSIKLFEKIDVEGLGMMKKALVRIMNLSNGVS